MRSTIQVLKATHLLDAVADANKGDVASQQICSAFVHWDKKVQSRMKEGPYPCCVICTDIIHRGELGAIILMRMEGGPDDLVAVTCKECANKRSYDELRIASSHSIADNLGMEVTELIRPS